MHNPTVAQKAKKPYFLSIDFYLWLDLPSSIDRPPPLELLPAASARMVCHILRTSSRFIHCSLYSLNTRDSEDVDIDSIAQTA